MKDRIDDLAARKEAARHAGSERSVERQHAKGKMLARERIDYLLDEGSFHELDMLARHRAHAAGLEEHPYFYFVHSYYPCDVDEDVIAATCDYGQESFCAAIERGALLATQFHPEKSQHAGLQLLENFLTR